MKNFAGINFRELPILKNFAGINFRESPILKNFAGISFLESTFLGVKKGIYFRAFGKISRNFIPAKVSSLKLFNLISFIWHFLLHLCIETSINMFIVARIKVNDQFIWFWKLFIDLVFRFVLFKYFKFIRATFTDTIISTVYLV